MQCECTGPGMCPRHNLFKSEELYQLCKQNRDIFLAYEVDSGNIKEPGIVQKAVNYGTAITKNALAGSPVVSETDRKIRMEACLSCPLLQDGKCLKCGCPVEEKVKLATERCPIDPPKWNAIITGAGCKSCGNK